MEESYKLKGLTSEEVKRRINDGKINNIPKPPSRTLGQILRANIFTTYNILNVVLATIVILAGSPKNAIFAGVIITNIIIGVFQEVRAKQILEKLSVINDKKVNVLRDGKIVNIDAEKIVLDDILSIKMGQQVLVDCQLIGDEVLEVDESMLTGEADVILKRKGDKLLSGSFVTGGSSYVKVTKVGEDTYAAKLAKEAKEFKIINSELQRSINKIFKVMIWIVIPISILLVSTQLMYGEGTWQEVIVSSVSGIVGMLPQGLILLTSATFVVAVIRLAKWNTLIQELPATEVLARVDVICLDKTGTITKGDLKVSGLLTLDKDYENSLEKIISGFAHNLNGGNQTDNAIIERFKENPNLEVIDKIPFSSKRKWSAISFKEEGHFLLGAPEMILKNDYSLIKEKVEELARKGQRVLLLAKFEGNKLSENLQGNINPIGLILIEDIIREGAKETIEYFKKEKVILKIISGDNPVTVSAIAEKVGIDNAKSYIDGRDIPKDDEALKEIVKKTCVFGRVTPHQKKRIVKALKENDHTVAMTGDGVNDVLALKESDCGIAMASGTDATRAVAQLVLMDSNFASLPHVVLEGRRLINNLEQVSELFLSKTSYFIILSTIFALLALPYPIMPVQLSLVGSLTIGIPSFFLALAPNNNIIKKGFLKRVLHVAIPNGILIGLSTTFVFLMGYYGNLPIEHCRSLTLATFGGLSLFVLFKVAKPLNLYRLTVVTTMAVLFALAFVVPIAREFFLITVINVKYGLLIIGVSTLAAAGMLIVPRLIRSFMNRLKVSNQRRN